ncbi:Holliday junction resolvase RuvX [Basilea psittacipulmonis]|uniref:Putative pre-16S rRNA nuclease n=1 Tax=Basilea psittacipulmonis DSM 24701 TaxID=1072685 RepID=A0A077DCE8_9BURK|nr:Holliday junction resolvase RuvX [Basilea psittacipulmonis]AIL32279.1 Holliday junction resolvase [Basilea psittacipulmonis DSM 24701]
MSEKIYLCFDYGLKKVGVALGNDISKSARPLGIIYEEEKAKRFQKIECLIKEWQPDELVVGLPLTTEGDEQASSKLSRRFANQLQARFHLPVSLQDERGTSMQAQEIVKNEDDDAVAASLILTRFLEKK